MNICYILNYPGSGGSEKYLLYLAKEAKKAGHTVSFVFGENGPFVEEIKKEDFIYEFIKMPWIFSPKASVRIKKYVSQNSIDIVHCNFLREQALVAFAKVLGSKVKLVRTIHRLDRFYKRTRLIMSFLDVYTDVYIAPSNFAKEKSIEAGYKEEQLRVIYNGAPEVSTTKPRDNAVGMLGRLDEEKGYLSLIQEMAQQNFKAPVYLAGTGPQKKAIKDLVTSASLKNVTLLGMVTDISDFFSKITTLAHPSINESTLPLSVIEALSTGRQAVVFDIPVMKEFSGPGLVKIKEGDWKLFVSTLSDNKNESDEIKAYYRKNFSIEVCWQRTESVYKSLI